MMNDSDRLLHESRDARAKNRVTISDSKITELVWRGMGSKSTGKDNWKANVYEIHSLAYHSHCQNPAQGGPFHKFVFGFDHDPQTDRAMGGPDNRRWSSRG